MTQVVARFKVLSQRRRESGWQTDRVLMEDTQFPGSADNARRAAIEIAGNLNRDLPRGTAIHRVWDMIEEQEVYRRGYHRKGSEQANAVSEA